MRRFLPLLGLSLVLAVLGCGAAKPRIVPVKGRVTLDGAPLSEGTIYFKTPSTGAMESFEVKNGEFAGKAMEGERRVEILAFCHKVIDVGVEKHEVKENFLPPRYNTESQLTATVTSPGPAEFSFAVTKK